MCVLFVELPLLGHKIHKYKYNSHTHTFASPTCRTDRYRVSHHGWACACILYARRIGKAAHMWICEYSTHTDAPSTHTHTHCHTCTIARYFFSVYKSARISILSLETFLFKLRKHHFRLVGCSEWHFFRESRTLKNDEQWEKNLVAFDLLLEFFCESISEY